MRHSAVSKKAAVAICIWLLGAGLSGCSLAGPSEVAFRPAKPPPAKLKASLSEEEVAERMQAKMEADGKACRGIARQRGVRSLLAIAQSANPRNTDRAYIACMKKKGWKVEGEVETPEEDLDAGADQAPAPTSAE